MTPRTVPLLVLCTAALLPAPLGAFERTTDDYGRPVSWPGAMIAPPVPPAELGPDASRLAERAFLRWTEAPCTGLRLERALTPRIRLMLVKEGWPHGASEAAHTSLELDRSSGQILGAKIELNGAFRFGTGSDEIDLESLLTHEAGHALGLAHSFDRKAVMHAGRHRGEAAAALQPDDIAGVCAAYPPGARAPDRARPWRWGAGALVLLASAWVAWRTTRSRKNEAGEPSRKR